jgi:hypothetical protein
MFMEPGRPMASREDAFASALLQAIPDPVIVALPDGRVTAVNRAAAQLFGRSGEWVHELLPFVVAASHGAVRRTNWEGVINNQNGRACRVQVRRVPLEDTPLEPAEGFQRDLYFLHDISRLVEANWWREQVLYWGESFHCWYGDASRPPLARCPATRPAVHPTARFRREARRCKGCGGVGWSAGERPQCVLLVE